MSVKPATLPITVLQSSRTPRPTTNPYISQLFASAEAGVTMRGFSWRRALLERADVFHVHWPEVLIKRSSRTRTALCAIAFTIALVRFRVMRTAIVRTQHNLTPHESPSLPVRAATKLLERFTTARILLNEETPVPPGSAFRVIPHGDYIGWFQDFPHPASNPGALLFFGLVRPYKGVEQLIMSFAALRGTQATLLVAGSAADPAYQNAIAELADSTPGVNTELTYLDDATLSDRIGRSELVVLPYRAMHNSGALLLALSLARPVLVPRNSITDSLAEEVGPGWVYRFDGDLDAEQLQAALDRRESDERGSKPDLSRRRWSTVAALHADAYRDAIERARARL